VAAVIDGLRAADMEDVLSGYDKACVAKCDAAAEVIVEAFAALTRGEWGSQWVRDNASVAVTANNIGTYLNLKRNGAPPAAPRSASSRLNAVIERAANGQQPAADAGGGWGGPGLGVPQVRRGLPRELPG
jgi:hypothetical protein